MQGVGDYQNSVTDINHISSIYPAQDAQIAVVGNHDDNSQKLFVLKIRMWDGMPMGGAVISDQGAIKIRRPFLTETIVNSPNVMVAFSRDDGNGQRELHWITMDLNNLNVVNTQNKISDPNLLHIIPSDITLFNTNQVLISGSEKQAGGEYRPYVFQVNALNGSLINAHTFMEGPHDFAESIIPICNDYNSSSYLLKTRRRLGGMSHTKLIKSDFTTGAAWCEFDLVRPQGQPNIGSSQKTFVSSKIATRHLYQIASNPLNMGPKYNCLGMQASVVFDGPNDQTNDTQFEIHSSNDATVNNIQHTNAHGQTWIYPNPSNDQVTLNLPLNESYSIQLYNLTGELIFHSVIAGDEKLDISNYARGMYYVHVMSVSGISWTERLVLE